MNIKDSYLHSDTPVIKSISVNADKLTYTLADKTESTKTITLPLATTSANGLLSAIDKSKLNKLNSDYFNDIVTYEIYPLDNGGRSTYILIAELPKWVDGSADTYYFIGRLVSARGGNKANTGVFNIVAMATSYKGDPWNLDHMLYVDTYSKARVLEPYIVSYNNKNYLALKKTGSSTYIYFEGIVRNILPQNEWIELNVEANETLPFGMTIVRSPNYSDLYSITTCKYFDGTYNRTLLHNGNLNFTTSGKNYAVNLSDNKLYVNVPWTDTKNTAGSTDSTSKLFLIGTTSQNTSPQTYSNSKVYATNGLLTADGFSGPIKGETLLNVNIGYKDLYFKFFNNVSGCASTVSTDGKKYAGTANSYGFPVSDNANSMLWLGAHSGPYGDQLGFSGKGIFHRRINNNIFPTNVNGGSWKQLAYKSDIPTSLKSPGTLTFSAGAFEAKTYDGSSDVSVNIPESLNHIKSAYYDVDIESTTRKTLLCTMKTGQGFISRAAFGLKNTTGKFASVIIGVGTIDDGTAFTDYYFSPDGSITDSKGNTYAKLTDLVDEKVKLEETTSNALYEILLSGNANSNTETTTSKKSSKLKFNPNTGTLSSTYIYTKGLKGQAGSLEDLMKSGLALAYNRFSKPSFSNETGITVSGNANGILWVGTHGPEASNTSDIGYGHMLGFVGGNGALYHKIVANGDTTKAWKQIAYTSSNITGNAASANKLKTARKLWGLDFDGSADVSGSLTGVTSINMDGDIVINDGTNKDRYIKFQYNNTDTYAWRIGYTGSQHGENNDFVIQTTGATGTNTEFSNVLQLKPSTKNAIFSASVTATSFIGDLTGNADTATKLATTRKLWGLDFDGSDNVSGSLSGVTTVTSAENSALVLQSSNANVYLRYNGNDNNSVCLISGALVPTTNSHNKLNLGRTENIWKGVYASNFYGNLDGTYVNALTGYSKATEVGSIADTDSLNTALGKLEYKADSAYELVKGAYDGDGTIENLAEILKVLEGIKDTETIQSIVGKYLPLTGGTLTGKLTLENENFGPLVIYRKNNTNSASIQFKNGNDISLGYIGMNEADKGLRRFSADTSASYKIWDEGNDGANSGLDADTLDGTHKSDLFTLLSNINSTTYPRSIAMTIGGTTKRLQVEHSNNTLNLNAERFDNKEGEENTLPPTPSTYTGLTFLFSHKIDSGVSSDWTNVLTMRSYVDKKYCASQIITPADDPGKDEGYSGNMKWRQGRNTTWLPWRTILDSANYSSILNNTYYTESEIDSLLTRYVTTDTNQNITGQKTFKNLTKIVVTGNHALTLRTTPSTTAEEPQKWVSLGMLWDEYTKDDSGKVTKTTTHSGYFVYKGGTNYRLTDEGWSKDYAILHAGNSSISDGVITINGSSITPITSNSLSTALSNYVTIDGEQTISGKKSFSTETYVHSIASNGFKYGVRLLGHGLAGYLQLGQITSGETKSHVGHITGIGGSALASLNISSNTTSFTGNITTKSNIEATGTITATGGFIGNLTGNADTATTAGCIPLVKITKESEIVLDANIRGYFGSGDSYDATEGNFTSLKYSALLSVGYPDRGFRLWISRYETDVAPGFHYTVGKSETNPAWVTERVLLDTYNFNSYVPKLDGTGANGTWNISITGNSNSAVTAGSLKSTAIKESLTKKLSNKNWVDTGYTFTDLPTGTYAIQVTSGSELVASGIMSVCKNLVDTIGDEIPLHVYGTANWRPYLRTHQNKLEISSTDDKETSRTVTIKIAQIL